MEFSVGTAQSCEETIGCPEPGRPLPGTIQDQELLLDENGLGDHGTDPSRAQESRKRNDDVDEKDDQIAHLCIVARTGNAGDWSENWQFAMDTLNLLYHRVLTARRCYLLPSRPDRWKI